VERGDHGATFTLQSMVLEYVTDRLVETGAEEIERGRPLVLVGQPLIKAQAKEYVRQTQERLIGTPMLQRLKAHLDERGTEQRLLLLLERWRGRPSEDQGSGPGNVVNLLRLLRGDLRGMDLSRLTIRQAYLAEVEAQDARLIDCHLAESVLADGFDLPGSVALSADGTLLAAGTSTGQVWLWRVADRTPLLAVQGHTGGAWGVALSADCRLVACGSADGTVRLWETGTGQPVATLEGHTGTVWGVALSADGRLLVSGGADGTVRLWPLTGVAQREGMLGIQEETGTGQPVATLEGHTSAVWGVALSADGRLAASGSGDGTVRLWSLTGLAEREGMRGMQAETARAGSGPVGPSAERAQPSEHSPAAPPTEWRAVATLQGHTGTVWGVALSADGRLVASGSGDGTMRLWGTTLAGSGPVGPSAERAQSSEHSRAATPSEWRPMATLQGHPSGVRTVALSADGQLVASGFEGTVRLWETGTGRPLATLQGHPSGVRSVALSSDGHLLASGGLEGTLQLWETGTGRPLATLQGHTSGVRSVALSSDGHLLASGGFEGAVQLWETGTGRPLATLKGHTSGVRGVALSADGHLLASGGFDGTVRLWEAALTGSGPVGPSAKRAQPSGHSPAAPPSEWRPVAILEGHTGGAWGVALSADGQLLASGGGDGTVRLSDPSTGRPLATLRGHTGGVWSVALSADGQLLASGGGDGTVRLWEPSTGRQVASLQGHTGTVWGVALSADSRMVASGSGDGTVRLWDPSTRRPLATLGGHTGGAWGVALSADGRLVASGSGDGTVRLWETDTGVPLATLVGHTGAVWGVALSADGQRVASGSFDGTVKLWETQSGTCLRTLRPERRYERLDITGLTGITDAQRTALLALGAVDRHAPVTGPTRRLPLDPVR
jgi:WD40 repeat protein